MANHLQNAVGSRETIVAKTLERKKVMGRDSGCSSLQPNGLARFYEGFCPWTQNKIRKGGKGELAMAF